MNWWEKDPRYGKAGWTLIHPSDGGRPYFVKATERKRRKPARALRFGDLQEGAVLIHRAKCRSIKRPRIGDTSVANEVEEVNHYAGFYVVKFRWFDPVAGQHDPLKGEMAGVCQVTHMGLIDTAQPHTLRGLASQGYHYATPEQAERVRAFIEERRNLLAAFDAGEATREELRLRAMPYRELVRGLA